MSSYSEAVNTRLENVIQHGNDTLASLQSIIGETNPITVTAALLGAINSYALRKLNLQIIGLFQAGATLCELVAPPNNSFQVEQLVNSQLGSWNATTLDRLLVLNPNTQSVTTFSNDFDLASYIIEVDITITLSL